MFRTSVCSASRQAPWIFSMLDRFISFLDSAEQSNTTVCLTASSLKANVHIWKVSAPILPIWNNNLTHKQCSWSLSFSEETKTALDTTHGHTSQQRKPQLWIQQQKTMQALLHCHIHDKYFTNCSSCGGQGVTGDSLTLQQKDPIADQYSRLPMVVEKCPSEQILWEIFPATETFVFYNQFLQNSIQHTTNNFPTTTWVEFNS